MMAKARICPTCFLSIADDQVKVCRWCRTAYHVACLDMGCAQPHCSQGRDQEQTDGEPPPQSPLWRPARFAWVATAGGGVVLMFSFGAPYRVIAAEIFAACLALLAAIVLSYMALIGD